MVLILLHCPYPGVHVYKKAHLYLDYIISVLQSYQLSDNSS